ncbi:MAG: hypothetical protein WDM85_00340 [Caulobacteraceae bacterium]
MVALGSGLGDNGGSFARFHAVNLAPVARRCLVKAKPVRDVDPQGAVSYSAFCGEVIYVFSKAGRRVEAHRPRRQRLGHP